jgi:SAM-dependent methyltransferase
LQALRPHRMLDVGGNSGEFARHAVRSVPGLSADVFDLPVVCELGRRHLASTEESHRVGFIPGDLRADDLPGGYDLVSFKSMLHDWPDEFAFDFLRKAVAALQPGGSILIFERAEIRATGDRLPYSMVANLVFLPFFRNAETYRVWLKQFGLVDISLETVMLEMPFHLITARKPL